MLVGFQNDEAWNHIGHDLLESLNKAPDLMSSVLQLVRLVHFNPDRPCNHNVRGRGERVEVWDGRAWVDMDGMDAAELIKLRILEHMEQHPTHRGQGRRYNRRDTERLFLFTDSASKLTQPTMEVLLVVNRLSRAFQPPLLRFPPVLP
jgi:hypothetical protein